MMKFLGEAEFTREKPFASIVLEQPQIAKFIKFSVTKNYGADFTCIYRVEVYANSTDPN